MIEPYERFIDDGWMSDADEQREFEMDQLRDRIDELEYQLNCKDEEIFELQDNLKAAYQRIQELESQLGCRTHADMLTQAFDALKRIGDSA